MLWALAGRKQTRRRQHADCGQLQVEETQPGRREGRMQQRVGRGDGTSSEAEGSWREVCVGRIEWQGEAGSGGVAVVSGGGGTWRLRAAGRACPANSRADLAIV